MDQTSPRLPIGPTSGGFDAGLPAWPEPDYAAYVVRLEQQIATHTPAAGGGDGEGAADSSVTRGEAER